MELFEMSNDGRPDMAQPIQIHEANVPADGSDAIKQRLTTTKRRAQVHSIQIDHEGKTHHATYEVENGILTVRSSLGSRSRQLRTSGTANAVGLAQQILRELAIR
jgi:hypothetical protein